MIGRLLDWRAFAPVAETKTSEVVPVAWLSLGRKAAFAVLDQGLFAGTNFIVNMLLARWLSPVEYGAFTVAYSVFWLLGTFHSAILTAPMLVFGVSRYAGHFRKYFGLLLCGHAAIAAATSCILVVTAAVLEGMGSTALSRAFLGLAVAAPFVLLLTLLRSAFYARFQPHWAVTCGALYLLFVISGLYGLFHFHRLSETSALVVMGGAGLIVGGLLIALIRPQRWWNESSGSDPDDAETVAQWGETGLFGHLQSGRVAGAADGWAPRAVLRDHLRYAKWDAASSATSWVGNNLQYLVLVSTGGLASVAAMRVLDSLLLPVFHFQTAVSRFLIPVFGTRSKAPYTKLLPLLVRVVCLVASLAIVAYVLIRSFASVIIPLLYGHAYAQYSYLLAWYGLILIPATVMGVLFAVLRARVRVDLIFPYQLLFSSATLIGLLIAVRHGLPGIVFARVVVAYTIPCFLPILIKVLHQAPRTDAVTP